MTDLAAAGVALEHRGTHVILWLDQPDRRANVLCRSLWNALNVALDRCIADKVAGLVIASRKPGIFLAGADLGELVSLADDAEARRVAKLGHATLDRLETAPFPTAAAVDGAALGGGLEVALACDYRIAGSHPKTRLGLPEVKLGLIPGWGGTQRTPRLIGVARAGEMLVTGDPLSSAQADVSGLIDGVVESDALIDTAIERLRRPAPDRRQRKRSPRPSAEKLNALNDKVAGLPEPERTAAQAAVQVMVLGLAMPLTTALTVETEAFVPLLMSEPARARMRGFLAR